MAVEEIPTGACQPWTTVADLAPKVDPDTEDKQAEAEEAVKVATDVLYALSGRQFPGLCTETLHPCADYRHRYRTTDPALGYPYSMTFYGHPIAPARMFTGCSHRRTSQCGCTPLHALDLGLRPLLDATVTIDGAAFADWRIDDEREIVRLDGAPWPTCQDLAAADGLIIEATYGIAPPPAGVRAAKVLATEIYLSRTDPDACRLPKRTQSISRQGISMTMLDPMEFLDGGRTGLYDVDLFLAAHNPHRATRRPAVLSPDQPRRVRRIGTGGPG